MRWSEYWTSDSYFAIRKEGLVKRRMPAWLRTNLLPHDNQIIDCPDTLPLQNKSKLPLYFAKLLQKIKFKYDIIVIDIPPTISIVTDVALFASDYAVFVVQTQKHSLEGAKKMFSYLETSNIY